MADPKQQKKFVPTDNPAEILKDTAREVVAVPKAIFDEALTQIGLKPRRQPLMGEINLLNRRHQNGAETARSVRPEIKLNQFRAIKAQEKEVFNARQRAIQEQVVKLMQELHAEVVRLQQQTAQLTQETKAVTLEMAPPKAGIYHINFMDWVIKTLRDLRKTVTESRMWLHMWTQKKRQKSFWAMAKKHGQKFMFSDERAVAIGMG